MHCVYVPQLSYPFICWWSSRLLPCPGYYKECCDEHWGMHVSFNSGFLGVYAQKWGCWVVWQFWSEVNSLSHVRLFATAWTVASQAPLSMGFSRQEYWSGLPFPPPGDLRNPGIEHWSPAWQADALSYEPPGNSWQFYFQFFKESPHCSP